MKIVLCSMIDDFFFQGFEVFMKSLLKTNPWFNLPIRLIDVGINKKNKEACYKIYSNLNFVSPKKENYKKISFEKTAECLWNTYYKLDIFSYTDVDRLIFLDLDMIVLGDLKPVFECDYNIAGCRGYSAGGDVLRKDMNTGLIVLNKLMLDDKVYKGILDYGAKIGGASMPDQKICNQYFRKKITFLPKKYNCEKRMFKGKENKLYFANNQLKIQVNGEVDNCSVVHFVSEKPWQEKKDKINFGYEKLEKIWWDIKNE